MRIRPFLEKHLFEIVYFGFCSAWTIILTWPVVLKMSSSIYGYPGDSFGDIYGLWGWKHVITNNLSRVWSPLSEAPFGVSFGAGYWNIHLYDFPLRLLTLVTDEVFSFNFFLLLTFPLAALTAYLLILRLTGNKAAATLAGLVFAFSPYHFWKAYNHLTLANIQWLPLYFLFLLEFFRRPRLLWAILLGLSLSLNTLTNYYYGYFLLLATGPFLLVQFLGIIYHRQWLLFRQTLLGYAIAFLLAAVIVFPAARADLRSAFSANTGAASSGDYQRPLENLLLLTSRPWDFFLPSQDHPLFGISVKRVYDGIRGLSGDFKTVSGPPHERTVFLGYFGLFSFLLTLSLIVRRRIKIDFFWPLLASLIFLVLVSLPPFIYWRGVKIYLPSYFLYLLFPMFRAYSRVGIIILLEVLLISSFGVTALLKRVSSLRQRSLLAVLFALFILFEFLNIPPSHVTDFSQVPPEYLWLAEQPGEPIIIEYPRRFNMAEAFLFQRLHQKPIANYHGQFSLYRMWDFLEDPYNPEVGYRLAALGIKYVFVHTGRIFDFENPVDELWWARATNQPLDFSHLPPTLTLVKDFGKTAVFAVGVSPQPKLAALVPDGSSFSLRWAGGNSWRWPGISNRLYLMNFSRYFDRPVCLGWSAESRLAEPAKVTVNGEEQLLPGDLCFPLRDGENVIDFQVPPSLEESKFAGLNLEEVR